MDGQRAIKIDKNKRLSNYIDYVIVMFILIFISGCVERENVSVINTGIGLYIKPDFDSRRIYIYNNLGDSCDLIEYKYYPLGASYDCNIYYFPPDTLVILDTRPIKKIHERNFKILYPWRTSNIHRSNQFGISDIQGGAFGINPHPRKSLFYRINIGVNFQYLSIYKDGDSLINRTIIKDLSNLIIH